MTILEKITRDYNEHLDGVFSAAAFAVCGDMPTAERFNEMGHVNYLPDGSKELVWGDNVIARVPPLTIFKPDYTPTL